MGQLTIASQADDRGEPFLGIGWSSVPYDSVSGMLIVMSGLPGAGKSSIAQELGRLPPAPVLSVDPMEAAMWRAGIDRGRPTGPAAYVVVEALASDVLALGQTVIVDAVNDAREAREQWRGLARRRSHVPEWFSRSRRRWMPHRSQIR